MQSVVWQDMENFSYDDPCLITVRCGLIRRFYVVNYDKSLLVVGWGWGASSHRSFQCNFLICWLCEKKRKEKKILYHWAQCAVMSPRHTLPFKGKFGGSFITLSNMYADWLDFPFQKLKCNYVLEEIVQIIATIVKLNCVAFIQASIKSVCVLGETFWKTGHLCYSVGIYFTF